MTKWFSNKSTLAIKHSNFSSFLQKISWSKQVSFLQFVFQCWEFCIFYYQIPELMQDKIIAIEILKLAIWFALLANPGQKSSHKNICFSILFPVTSQFMKTAFFRRVCYWELIRASFRTIGYFRRVFLEYLFGPLKLRIYLLFSSIFSKHF